MSEGLATWALEMVMLRVLCGDELLSSEKGKSLFPGLQSMRWDLLKEDLDFADVQIQGRNQEDA